jgi:WD40 repeat protein
MELTGHSGEIFAAKFDPTGMLIASGSMDRSICELSFHQPVQISVYVC